MEFITTGKFNKFIDRLKIIIPEIDMHGLARMMVLENYVLRADCKTTGKVYRKIKFVGVQTLVCPYIH